MFKRLINITALFLGFTGLGLFFSSPLAQFFSSAIPYGGRGEVTPFPVAGDHLQIYYNLWHIAHNLFSGRLFDAYEFAVPGSNYSLSFFYFPVSWLLAPITYFCGPILTYNLFLLGSFGLCGIFTYALVRTYTREPWGAFLAALLFALAPYRLSQLFGGHINGFLAFCIPLALWVFERGWKFLFLLILVAIYCADLQLFYFFLLVITPYFLLRLWANSSSLKDFCWRLLPFVGTYLAVLGLFLLAKNSLLTATLQTGGRELHEVKSYPFWALFRKSPGSVEGNLYLSWVPLVLMLGATLAYLLRKKEPLFAFPVKLSLTIVYFVLGAILTAILSLGMSHDGIFPLYRWFYEQVPYFSFSRTPSRLILLSHFFIAVLAGISLSSLVQFFRTKMPAKISGWITGAAALLICILAVQDLHFFKRVALCRVDQPPAAYRYLAQQANRDGRIVFLPLFPHQDHFASMYEYAVATTGWKMLQGYSAIPPVSCKEIEEELQPLHEGKITPEGVAFLKEQNVKYLAFHPRLYLRRKGFPDPKGVRQALMASPHFLLEKAEPQTLLFRFLPEPLKMDLVQGKMQVLVGAKAMEIATGPASAEGRIRPVVGGGPRNDMIL